jgi:hypothetical protein
MGRVALGLALVVAVGWFMFGRGGDAQAVTDCISDAGATVQENARFGQVFPYAIAARSLDDVQSYPELEGARFYFVTYGSDRAMLFVGKGDDEAEAFETTLRGMVVQEGGAFAARRAGKTLLVWERPTVAPAIDACLD